MREEVAPPRPLRHEGAPPTGSEELFYFGVGLNYEVFVRLPEAVASYDLALSYPVTRPAAFKNLAARKTHCLMMMGRPGDAVEFLDTMAAKAPTPRVAEQLRGLRETIRRREALKK